MTASRGGHTICAVWFHLPRTRMTTPMTLKPIASGINAPVEHRGIDVDGDRLRDLAGQAGVRNPSSQPTSGTAAARAGTHAACRAS